MQTLEKVFSSAREWLQERSSDASSTKISSRLYYFKVSNHTVFLIQFEINLHL